jgi:Uncharacterized conserved protein (some members contain a von Willebrand factor type A (vWA) domain)
MKAQQKVVNKVQPELADGQLVQGFKADGSKAGSEQTGTGGLAAVLDEQRGRPFFYRTRWGAWFLISIGWAVSLAGVLNRGGAVETFMLIILSLLPILSIVMPLFSTIGLSVSRIIPETNIKDGDEAVVKLALKRTSAVPFVWLAVHDGLTNTSAAEKAPLDYRYIVMPLLRKEVEITYSVLAVRRGEHQFGQVKVTIGDWLGLTAIHRRLECPGTLIAVPALPEEMGRRAGRLHGAIAEQVSGDPSAAYIGDNGEISETTADRLLQQAGIGPDSRPYREGDSMRHMNWRAAAKGRGLFTKQHMLEQPAEIIMIADTCSTAYDHDGRLFDASLAWMARGIERAAAEGCEIRLFTGADMVTKQDKKASPLHKGERKRGSVSGRQTKALLERLAKLRLVKAAVSVDSLRTKLGGLKPGGAIHVYTADWKSGQSWIQLAAYAAQHSCRIELHVVTKQSVLTYAMREQQRLLEQAGLLMNWLAYPERMNRQPQTAEGGGQHARVQS